MPQLGVISDQASGERRGSMQCGPLYQWMHGILVVLLEDAVAGGEAQIDYEIGMPARSQPARIHWYVRAAAARPS